MCQPEFRPLFTQIQLDKRAHECRHNFFFLLSIISWNNDSHFSASHVPVLVCVNVAAQVNRGAICVAAGWQRKSTGELCNEAEKWSWSRGQMEWPQGRTFATSSIWSPLLHPHQWSSICWWRVQDVQGLHLHVPTLQEVVHWFALTATVGLSTRGNHSWVTLKAQNLACSFLHGQDTSRVRVRGVM